MQEAPSMRQGLESAILLWGYQPTSAELEQAGMTTEECTALLAHHERGETK
jgi:hypothetical protein